MAVDGAVDDVAGHKFRQAGGVALLMFVTGGQDLTGGVVHQHPGACLDGRRRHGDGKIISGKGARNARSEQSYSNKKTAFQRHILKIYRFAVLFTEVLLSYHGLIARKYDTINALRGRRPSDARANRLP